MSKDLVVFVLCKQRVNRSCRKNRRHRCDEGARALDDAIDYLVRSDDRTSHCSEVVAPRVACATGMRLPEVHCGK